MHDYRSDHLRPLPEDDLPDEPIPDPNRTPPFGIDVNRLDPARRVRWDAPILDPHPHRINWWMYLTAGLVVLAAVVVCGWLTLAAGTAP